MLHGDFFFLARIVTGNFPENISVDSDMLLQNKKQKNRKKNWQYHCKSFWKKKIEAKPTISFNEQVNKEFPRATESIFNVGFYSRHAFKVEKERHGDVLWVTIDVNVFARRAFIWTFGNGIGSEMALY